VIRQAHSYLVGAVFGTALVAVAVVAFVLLISAQALRSWPIGGLGFGGDNSGAVSPAFPAPQAATGAAAKTTASSQSAAKDGATGSTGSTSPQPEVTGSSPGGQSAPSSPAATAPGQQKSPQNSSLAGSGPNPVTSGGGGSGPTGAGGSVTDTVNDAAAAADQALGGTLSENGVTKATETVTEGVNGVTGPNSAIGQTVNQVAGGGVDGVLNADR
jgi:collagen type VII alpha